MKPTCTQRNGTGVCGKPAVAIIRNWPGDPKEYLVCKDHKEKGERIACALGLFDVRFDPIPDKEKP